MFVLFIYSIVLLLPYFLILISTLLLWEKGDFDDKTDDHFHFSFILNVYHICLVPCFISISVCCMCTSYFLSRRAVLKSGRR